MGVYYLDTSALVKRYVTETGTGWVRTITDPVVGHDIYVVKIAGPEGVSAFVRQAPPLPKLATVLANFTFDFSPRIPAVGAHGYRDRYCDEVGGSASATRLRCGPAGSGG